MAETISLQLTIISAKDLNKVNLVGKMYVYAVVYIIGAGNQDQKQKTRVDKDGDSNPTWNHPMKFTIDESAALQNRLTLVVKIKSEGMFGDKDVGEVHVPIKELLEGHSYGSKPLRFVSYQVRKPSGKPKGELSFSCKFGEKSAGKHNKADKLDETATAYPAVGYGFSSVYPPLYAAPVSVALASYPPAPTTASPVSYPPVGSAGKQNSTVELDEPVMAYPAVGSSSVYPPMYAASVGAAPGLYPPAPITTAPAGLYPPAGGDYHPPVGYPQPKAEYAYQQQPTGYGGYPPLPAQGYGGYPPQPGYGYPSVQQPHKDNKLGLGLGLLGGALGGLLIGDLVSDAASGGGCGGGCGGF